MSNTINKNIEIALEKIEASNVDKQIIKAILYKEHTNKESAEWNGPRSSAPAEIKAILRENETDEEVVL